MDDKGWAEVWLTRRRCCDSCVHFAADGTKWTCGAGGEPVPVPHPGAITWCGDYERRRGDG